MTNTHPSPMLANWREIALDGLPHDVNRTSAAEFDAHFADGVAERIAEGQALLEAQKATLDALGSASQVNRALRDAHLGRWSYRLAALLSMFNIIALMIVPMLHDALLPTFTHATKTAFLIAANVALFIPTIIVLNIYRRLLEWRFGVAGLHGLVRVISASLLLYLMADMVGMALYDASIAYFNPPILSAETPLPQWILSIVAAAVLIVCGLVLLVLAARLLKEGVNAAGLSQFAAVLIGVLGVALSGVGVSLIIGFQGALLPLMALDMLAHFLVWPVLTLLFYREIARPSPIRYA